MTKKIQKAICAMLIKSGAEAVCENYGHCWEMDVAYMSKSGMIYEYEVKISRSDFLADKKRKTTKFAHYDAKNEFTAPNYFFYVCPKDLIDQHEIPSYAGLYYYTKDGLKCIKWAKRIHKGKVRIDRTLKKMLRLNVQRAYIGSSLLTYHNKESRKIYDAMMKEQAENRKRNESLFSDNQ